ncbi:MAG TPA: thermonuclease family protein [Thermoanaerobaculia bacterium]
MRKRWVGAAILGLLALGLPAHAGDSLYGRVTEVKSGNIVTLDYGAGQYELRLVGIELPNDKVLSERATGLVKRLVLGKNARMRFEGRSEDGVMNARLFTDDPEQGIQEVAVELLRAGLVKRAKDVDFKYGELSAAESEARDARRGLWAADQQR